MRWSAKENRRATPRHAYDGTETWIRPEGSLTRLCQVVDLSKTGVRLKVTNAQSLPNTFTLMLSKNSGGYRPALVKWRHGNEIGAEFFSADSCSVSQPTADVPRTNPSSAVRANSSSDSRSTGPVNSSSASRLAADAPRSDSRWASRLTADAPRTAIKAPEGQAQKSENLASTLSLHTQAQQPDVAKLKADTRKVIDSIGGDKAKAKTEDDRRVTNTGGQVDRTDQKINSKKRMDLTRLQKKLGPKHIALIHAVKDIDPESPHGQELASIIESLDKTSDEQPNNLIFAA